MAEVRKVLGQVFPSPVTDTRLYQVPPNKEAVVSTFTACNQGSVAAQFRLRIAVLAAPDDPKQYIFWDVTVAGKSSFVATIGMTLSEDDDVRVYVSTDEFSFNLFGVEIGV